MMIRLLMSFAAACLLSFALPMSASAHCGSCGAGEAAEGEQGCAHGGEGEHAHAEGEGGCHCDGGCEGAEAEAGCGCGEGCDGDCAEGGNCDCAGGAEEAGSAHDNCAFCQGDATAECTCGH